MRIASLLAAAGSLGLAACGGSSMNAGSVPNPFLGTLSITDALPAGTTTCQATHTVTFTSTGVSVHTVSAAGGDCLTFTNADTASHRPASIGSPTCPELDASVALTQGQSFTTTPLGGPKTCLWEDALNPPSAGAGGGGGGGGGY
jgi:hypothetical protein